MRTNKKAAKQRSYGLLALIVVLAAGFVATGYLLNKERTEHAAAQKILDENAQVIQAAKLESGFRKVLQEHVDRECYAGQSGILFNTATSVEKNDDGSVKKYFAVGQYVCTSDNNVLAGPIRFTAAQSYDGATWQFTYGASTVEPRSLPSYIFNTDPALYNLKYNNPKTF